MTFSTHCAPFFPLNEHRPLSSRTFVAPHQFSVPIHVASTHREKLQLSLSLSAIVIIIIIKITKIEVRRRGERPSPRTAPPLDRPKLRSFFDVSRTHFHSFFLSWGSSRGILVFSKAGALKCSRLGSRVVVSWRPHSRRGFTRQPENSKRAHFRAPALQTPLEEGRMKENGSGKRKNKSAKFWATHPLGPHPAEHHPAGPHPAGPHLAGSHPAGSHPSGPLPKCPLSPLPPPRINHNHP